MAHKYSHALVMSQFQGSGLLNPGSETPPDSKSSRISQSWTISEVIPPSKPFRSASPVRYAPSQRRAPVETDGTLSPRRASIDVAGHSVSLSRSDSIVTQVYAPRSASPNHEVRRTRKHRSKRRLSKHTASAVMYDDPWDLLSPSYEVASPKSTRCECGGIVQDARLQSSYFPETRPVQKPLPGLPVEERKNSVEHKQYTVIGERSSTPRFELAAEPSPRLVPTEATIKPIRRMAPPRTPTTETPASSRSSSSKPKPGPIATSTYTDESAKRKSEAASKSSSEAATNSLPLSSQTTPPTSPSVQSIFSVPSRFSQNYANNDDFHKIPIHDKDIVTLPWNDPKMGPALFCTSPPPGLMYPPQPPSPGSSIDDATPPPISRVRRQPSKPIMKPKRTTFKTHHNTRPRALSSPTASSFPSPPLPFIPPLSINKAPPPAHTTSPPPQINRTPQPYTHYKAPRPSLDVRSHVTGIPYQDTVAGPEPVPTDERVAPPPPLSTGLIRASKEKEVERWRFRNLKGMLGFGNGGGMGKGGNGSGGMGRRGVGTGFMRGLVSGG